MVRIKLLFYWSFFFLFVLIYFKKKKLDRLFFANFIWQYIYIISSNSMFFQFLMFRVYFRC